MCATYIAPKNVKQIFLEMKLRMLVSKFCIYVSVNDLYIPAIGPQMQNSITGGPTAHIYVNAEIGNNILEIFFRIFAV